MIKQPNTAKKNTVLFWSFVTLEIILIFALNLNHQNQQYIFEHRYLPLSQALVQGNGYGVLYPMWGYSILLTIGVFLSSATAAVLIMQAILCFISLWLVYKLHGIPQKFYHILLFIPFIALMSVKWPDAVVAFLLVVFVYYFKKYLEQRRLVFTIACGLIEGVILNFRSEYLYLGIIILLVYFFYKSSISFASTIKFVVATSIIAITCLIPWGLNTYHNSGVFRLGSSNSGLVLFTTLGQLPDNPWHITPTDQFGEDYAHGHNIADAYSNSGDSLLSSTFTIDIKEKPVGYVEKTAFNFASIFFRGLYIGEYSQATGVELIDKIIKVIFIPIFSLLIIWFFYSAYRSRKTTGQMLSLWLPITSIVIYKVVLVCLIQYEPRHMNAVYLLILVGVFSNLPERSKQQ